MDKELLLKDLKKLLEYIEDVDTENATILCDDIIQEVKLMKSEELHILNQNEIDSEIQ